MVQFHLEAKQQSAQRDISMIHFVEAAPSMLQEMPWIQHKESKVSIMLLYFIFYLYPETIGQLAVIECC